MDGFSYELSRIETAKNRIERLRRRLDPASGRDDTALRLALDYEVFEAEKLINLMREHIQRETTRSVLSYSVVEPGGRSEIVERPAVTPGL